MQALHLRELLKDILAFVLDDEDIKHPTDAVTSTTYEKSVCMFLNLYLICTCVQFKHHVNFL